MIDDVPELKMCDRSTPDRFQMRPRWARIQRSHNLDIVLLAIVLLAAAPAEGQAALYNSGRKLSAISEIDKAYLLPGEAYQQSVRHKCRGIGQFEQLRGEWVRSCKARLHLQHALLTCDSLPVACVNCNQKNP